MQAQKQKIKGRLKTKIQETNKRTKKKKSKTKWKGGIAQQKNNKACLNAIQMIRSC